MSHLRDTIKDHLQHTVGILVADHEPCISFNARIPADKRTSHRSTQGDLKAAWCKSSFAMAVILCPGTETVALANFAAKHKLDPERVHFYHTPETDVVAALRAWRQAGLAVHSIFEVKDGGGINKHFAAHWNHIMHDAVCRRPACRMHTIE
ncbi:MAG: hypothetical protein AABY18_00765 [Candidatus Thermoplasmatota archaeon]